MVGGNFWARIQKSGGLGDGRDGALVMRQPTNAFGRISYPLCSRSSHLESGALFPLSLFLAVIVPGVWVLLRSIFRKMSLSVGAMLGSTVDFCSASVLWWLRTYFTHFLRCGGLESFSVLSPFGLNGEVCPVDASGCSLALRRSHLETSFSRASHSCDVIRDRNFWAPVQSQVPGCQSNP